jgi:hypothetical protein
MMKPLTGLLRLFDNRETARAVEEELRLHLDLLTDEHCRQNTSPDEARALAQKRFGDFEQITDQCVKIRLRNSPLKRALKYFLVLLFLVGLMVRVAGPEYHIARVCDVLMMVGLLGRLLLYVRGLSRSTFLSKPDISSQLILFDRGERSIAAFDQKGHTPLERLIFYK